MLEYGELSGETSRNPKMVDCFASLNHLLEKAVDKLFPVAKVSSLGKVVGLLPPATTRVVKLEVPKEVVGDFEVRSDGEDFVDEILDANDAEFAQSLLDDFVGEGASASLELAVSAFVNEFANGFEIGVSPSDVRVGDSQHAQSRLVQLNESGVVDLTESQQLQNLPDSGVKAVDTPDPHDDGEFGFGGNVKVSMLASVTSQTQFVSFRLTVLLDVLLGAFEDGRALRFGLFLLKKRSFDLFGAEF